MNPVKLRALGQTVANAANQIKAEAARQAKMQKRDIERAKAGKEFPAELWTDMTLEQITKWVIEERIAHFDGNKGAAAASLDIGLKTVYRKIGTLREIEGE